MKLSNRFETMLTSVLAIMLLMVVAEPALAGAAGGGAAGVRGNVQTFMCDILGMVNITGLAIVTISIFVFGYQVAFGGKRPSEAAPVLVGGLIIGLAGTFASFFVPGGAACP